MLANVARLDQTNIWPLHTAGGKDSKPEATYFQNLLENSHDQNLQVMVTKAITDWDSGMGWGYDRKAAI